MDDAYALSPGAREAAALYALEQARRPDSPIDGTKLALRLELTIAPDASCTTADLVGDVISISPYLDDQEFNWLVYHELGHHALRMIGLPDEEPDADAVGRALALPIYAFDPDRYGWDLAALKERFPLCPMRVIAHRIADLRMACFTEWDNGKVVKRLCHAEAPAAMERATAYEAELARTVASLGGIHLTSARVVAFAEKDRVWTLCDPTELYRLIERPVGPSRLGRLVVTQ